jgi:hypothetical protein
MNSELQCPVDPVTVNENKARIIAFFVLLITAGYLLTGYWYLIALLLPDFLLRASTFGKNSPLSLLADIVVRLFKVKNKPTNRAPKRFAAGTGFVFTVLILLATLFQWQVAALVLSVILAFFASLESFVSFCAGCYVYTILQKLSWV